jgi:hypothetical protein
MEKLQAAAAKDRRAVRAMVSELNAVKKRVRQKDAALSDATLQLQLKSADLVTAKLELQAASSEVSAANLALQDKEADLRMANQEVRRCGDQTYCRESRTAKEMYVVSLPPHGLMCLD